MSVGDGVEIAGLVVAFIVGIPAAVAAVITIKAYIEASHRSRTGEASFRVCPRRKSGLQLAIYAASVLRPTPR